MSIENHDFYVYIHRTADDGRIFYVGKGRKYRANDKVNRNPWWKKVSKKHGLVVEFVATGLSEDDAFALEIETIAKYDNLCNLTAGGEGNAGWNPSEECRKRMSESAKTRGPHPGLMEAMHEAWSRQVICVDDGIVYKSLRDAARSIFGDLDEVEIDKRAGNIGSCCRGPNRQAYGRIWRYIRDGEIVPQEKEWHPKPRKPRSAESIEKVASAHRGSKRSDETRQKMSDNRQKLPVRCIETGMEFNSARYAAEWLATRGVQARSGSIQHAVTGRQKTAYGYTWEYV